MKNVKTIITRCLFWLIVIVPVVYFVVISVNSVCETREIVNIKKNHSNIQQFIESDISVSHLYYVEKPPMQYIWWEMPTKRIHASGPPVFIFDENGDCCDYTPDIGDDPKFQKEWGKAVNRGQEITLSDIKKKFVQPISTDDLPDTNQLQ